MALVLADRVEQVTRTTGFADLTLAETIRGRQSFASVVSNGDTVIYVLEDAEGMEWEIGVGTIVLDAETTLERTTIRASSNAGAKISLSAGTHRVFLAADAGTHRVFLAADAQYLTDIISQQEVDQAIADHVAEPDPHPQYTTAAEAAAAAPVQTVNGQTGTVSLDAAAVGATPDSHVGSGGAQHAEATTSVAGFMSAVDKTKLDGVEAGATADQSAAEVPYDNSTSGLTATDVQAAVDEVDSAVDEVGATLDAHIAGADPHPQYQTESENDARYAPITRSRKNLLINGNFAINQRKYVSGAATSGANQYTLDRFRVVVSGQSLNFTPSGNGNEVTAPAGGLEQAIEGANIAGGTYTLSWQGTATATVDGATVANGGQVTLTVNTNAVVRFSGGTVSRCQLEQGGTATDFEYRPIAEELALCQRYYWNLNGDVEGNYIPIPILRTSDNVRNTGVWFPQTMRAVPSVVCTVSSGAGIALDITQKTARAASPDTTTTSAVFLRSLEADAEL